MVVKFILVRKMKTNGVSYNLPVLGVYGNGKLKNKNGDIKFRKKKDKFTFINVK